MATNGRAEVFNFVGRLPDEGPKRDRWPAMIFGFDPRRTYLQDIHPRTGAQGCHLNRGGWLYPLPRGGERMWEIDPDQDHRWNGRCRPRIGVTRRSRRDTRKPPSPHQPRPQRHLPGFLSVTKFIGIRKYYFSRKCFSTPQMGSLRSPPQTSSGYSCANACSDSAGFSSRRTVGC